MIRLGDSMKVKVEYRSNMKHMNLRLLDAGTILVRANPQIKQAEIEAFVAKQQDWIRKQVAKQQDKQQLAADALYILGKEYRLIYQTGAANHVETKNAQMIVTHRPDTKRSYVLNQHLSALVKRILAERLDWCMQYFPKLKKPRLVIKKLKSKWGSCKYRESEIMLNVCLLYVPIPLIDYVVIHELMHFYYPDHQQGFHSGMSKVMPQYKEYQKELRSYEWLLRQGG